MKEREITDQKLDQLFDQLVALPPVISEEQVNSLPYGLPKAPAVNPFKQFLNNPPIHKYLLDPKSADKDVHFGQLSNGKLEAPHSFGTMPCLYPEGSFQMKIYKPDSTVNYTLQIKK